MRYLLTLIALIALVGITVPGGPADAASVVNPVTPDCRSELNAAQQAGQGDFVDKYETCLKRLWNANLMAAQFLIDDVERLADEVRAKAHFLSRRRTCLPSGYLTQFRDETVQRAERLRRRLASFDTVREMIIAEHRADLSDWLISLRPEDQLFWSQRSISFGQNFGLGDPYDAIRLAAQDAAGLKDEIKTTIVQKQDCEPTPANFTGLMDDALQGAIDTAGAPIPKGCGDLTGDWEQVSGNSGTSTWTLTGSRGGPYHATEDRLGEAEGPATLDGSTLTIDWKAGTWEGRYVWPVGPNCTGGTGKLFFDAGPRTGQDDTSTVTRL